MARESAFGAEPEQLRELLSFGLEDSSEQEAAPTASLNVFMEKPGGQIGRYKLLSVLGERGMGIVYLAEQKQPIRRQVALKVIKPGMDSKRVIARFEAERQALALLDHPNIAQVYDAGAKKVAQSRRTEIATLAKKLHKEIEWIPLKAMRKERSERYRSASELADDIENYLKGAPLIAGPPSTVYRLKKFIRRNRAFVTGIAAVLAVLVTGVIASTCFAIRAERARAEAQAIADFLQNGIEALTLPGQAKGTEVSLHDLLIVWSKKLEGRFDDKPLIEASIRATLGWAYRYIYELKVAETHLERALQIRQEQIGPEHPQTLSSMDRLAWLRWDQGQYVGAAELAEEALSTSRRVLGDEHDITLTLVKMLGCVYIDLGRYDEAEQLYLKGLRAARRVKSNVTLVTNLGMLYSAQGRYEEAERQYNESLHDGGADDEDSQAAICKSFLARVYMEQRRYTEAKELYLKILPIQRREVGNQHWHTLRSANGLARVHTHLGEYGEAETLLKEVLDARKFKLGEDHPLTLETINDFGVLCREQGQHDEAQKLLTEVRDKRQTTLGSDHPATLESTHELAVLYKKQARYQNAEDLLLQAVEGRRLKLGDKHPFTLNSWRSLIELYEAWGKPEKAEEWRAKLLRTKAVEE
ncbi:MAG: tetratricopeptide repeat protein [Planctomycetota bacterium]